MKFTRRDAPQTVHVQVKVAASLDALPNEGIRQLPCWSQKALRISASEFGEARKAFDHAQEVYRQRIAESDRQ